MGKVEFSGDIVVTELQVVATDKMACNAARISTGKMGSGEQEELTPADVGLVGSLMRNGHGSVWEQCMFRFRVEAPIFVAREHFRHRTQSFNEMSGRYTELPLRFYVPETNRLIIREEGTKTMQYQYESDPKLMRWYQDELKESCVVAAEKYESAIIAGIVPEVARMVLPVNIFTMYEVTMNARALFAFLQLRTDRPDSFRPSKPLLEIQAVAEQIEESMANHMPESYKAFEKSGRVAP